jgi:putative acetyltransferase
LKLVTKRLLIREFEFSDDLDLFEMCSDPYTAYDAGWYPHTNLHITKGVLLNYTSTYETFAIVLQETNKVIGTISLYTANIRKTLNCRELGFCLNKAYRNRGYMTEAVGAMLYYGFKELNLDMIMVCHHEKNNASKAVINKFPFVYEGTLRMYRKLWDDTIVDGVMYSMKKEEYWRYKK